MGAEVDQHYISKVALGQLGNFTFDDQRHELIIDKMLNGLATPLATLISPDSYGYNPNLEVYAHDFFPTDYPDVDVLLAAHRHGSRNNYHFFYGNG